MIGANAILMMERDPEQIRIVREALSKEGCRVYGAATARAVWEMMKLREYQLILIDIAEDEEEGFSLCCSLKQKEGCRDIPVIFVTDHYDAETLKEGFDVGGSDYILRPFIEGDLLERVKVRIQFANVRIQLQRANAELDKFCYTLSHDVRAPMYVVKQLTEILCQEISRGNYEEAMTVGEMLKEKADKTASMAEGLHRFSRELYGALRPEVIDVSTLVREVYEEQKSVMKLQNVRFYMEQLPPLYGDPNLIRSVFQNIISNALKFTSRVPSPEIRVNGGSVREKVFYEVKDNGIGFDDSCGTELFELFRKLNEDDYPGDGIGLATVKRIVNRHMGKVKIHGSPGKGCTVRLIFPNLAADKKEIQ